MVLVEFSPGLIATTGGTEPSDFLATLLDGYHVTALGHHRSVTGIVDIEGLIRSIDGTHVDLLCRPR